MSGKQAEFGKISDDAVERMKSRIDVERKQTTLRRRPLLLTRETIRRFAIGLGDDNPLYLKKDYSGRSRFGTIIAPPTIVGFVERANASIDGFPGCHAIWREAIYEWYRPMKLDDVIDSSTYLRRVEVVPSKFGGGQAAVQDYETLIWNQDQESVGNYKTSWHRFERSEAKRTGKYAERELASYTPEDIEKIKAEYKKEVRRGTEVLWWDDVCEGEEIPFVIKGPTTQISKFAFESWGGAGGWFVGHRLAFELFEKHPGLPFTNEQGVPEAPVAIHWSNERSQRYLGLPGAYEAGYERSGWLVHMLMNWIGDDGLVHRLTQRYPAFSLLGDTTWCRGTAKEKYILDAPIDGKRHAVRCDVSTVNQRGDVTTTGEAVVLLRAR